MNARPIDLRKTLRAPRLAIATLAIMGIAGCGAPIPPQISNFGDVSAVAVQLSDGTTVEPKSNTHISIEHAALDFGSNLDRRWVEIDFNGNPSLIYTISGASWVDSRIERSSELDNSIRLIVEIDRSQLVIGGHSAILTVGAAGANAVDVVVKALSLGDSQSALTVSPQTLDFGPEAVTLSTVLANIGDLTLTYTVESSVTWAQPSSRDGVIDVEDQAIQVTVSRDGLYPRTYFGWLEIRADNGQIGVINLIMTVPDEAVPDPLPDDPNLDPGDPSDPGDPDQTNADHLFWWPTLAGLDLDILDTFLSSGRMGEVLLSSYGSYRHPLLANPSQPSVIAERRSIEEAIAVCRNHDVTPILSRHLWPDLPGQEPPDHMFDAAFYRERWTLTAQEANLFNIEWAFDIEPYKPQPDQPTAIFKLIREQHERHESVGPLIAAAISATFDLEQPTYVLPGCTHNPINLYSQMGQQFEAARRIAVPPSYDHDRSDKVTIEHEAMQWIFAPEGVTGRFNFAHASHLAETDRRILIYVPKDYLAEFADELLAFGRSQDGR